MGTWVFIKPELDEVIFLSIFSFTCIERAPVDMNRRDEILAVQFQMLKSFVYHLCLASQEASTYQVK